MYEVIIVYLMEKNFLGFVALVVYVLNDCDKPAALAVVVY